MARYIASLALLASAVVAQTSTSCNPLKGPCPADPGITDSVFTTDFTKSSSLPSGWSLINQGGATYNGNGANIILAKQGDSPIIQSNGYFLFGSFEVTMKAAPGQGVVSSLVLLSDDLDEVDWEFTGTNGGQVQSNYFGKGDTSSYDRAAWHGVATPQTTVHTYKIDWTPSAVTWYIDNNIVRVLNYADAQGGARFPQTPMRARLGIWAGGDPANGEGTVQWAGGPTDFSKVPYTMFVQKVTITNYSPGKSYSFGDTSGSYGSIKIEGGALMNNKGAVSATTSTSLSTSLSKATGAPTNPVTVAPQAKNGTSATATGSGAKQTGPSSTSGKPAQSTNGAMGSMGVTGLTTAVFAAVGGCALLAL